MMTATRRLAAILAAGVGRLLRRLMRTVLGIDAAWTGTQPSGVALAEETERGWRLDAVAAPMRVLTRWRGGSGAACAARDAAGGECLARDLPASDGPAA